MLFKDFINWSYYSSFGGKLLFLYIRRQEKCERIYPKRLIASFVEDLTIEFSLFSSYLHFPSLYTEPILLVGFKKIK